MGFIFPDKQVVVNWNICYKNMATVVGHVEDILSKTTFFVVNIVQNIHNENVVAAVGFTFLDKFNCR